MSIAGLHPEEEEGLPVKIPWKRIGTGLKIALNIAIKLDAAHVINVKELGTVKTVKEIIESEVSAAKPLPPAA
jgi:hypothetical protein